MWFFVQRLSSVSRPSKMFPTRVALYIFLLSADDAKSTETDAGDDKHSFAREISDSKRNYNVF